MYVHLNATVLINCRANHSHKMRFTSFVSSPCNTKHHSDPFDDENNNTERSFENVCSASQRVFSEDEELVKMSSQDIFQKYRHKICVSEKIVPPSASVFAEIGKKLNKSIKAVYLMMKKVHKSILAQHAEVYEKENVDSFQLIQS